MDLAQNLIRSVVRAFYPPECILIIDAVVLHSALRKDDLATLMGSQTKHVRKLCIRLRDDGLLNFHSRAEIKEGARNPYMQEYYYINFHHAIDVIKFRLKSMTREVERRWGQTEDEKKEYFCDTCKSEWTQMDVLDNIRPDGEFGCKKCGSALRADYEQNSVGHEMQSRLNAQLAPFEKLMRQIDDVQVPENDFEAALANARPVDRDPLLNPMVKTEVANLRGGNLPAATVYGMKTEQDRIQVSLHDDTQAEQQEAEEAERRAKLAAQNALPEWYTTSTVTGEQTALGMREEAARREREANGQAPSLSTNGDASEDKKPAQAARDNSQLESYFAAVREEQLKQNRENDEDEDDDSDDEDEDDEDEEIDYEDVAIDADDTASPTKRVKIAEPGKLTSLANGLPSRLADDSAAASASTSTGNSTPLITPAAPAEEKSAVNETPKSGSGEDSDEDEFEDVV